MADEIKIGEEVLDYIAELGNIGAELQEAYTYAVRCVTNLSEGSYQGNGRGRSKIIF